MKKTVLIHANYWDGERMCRDGRIEIADGYVDAVYGACDEQNLKPYNIEETCFEDMSGIYLFPVSLSSFCIWQSVSRIRPQPFLFL